MRLDRCITLNLVQPFRHSLFHIGWGEGGRSPDEVHDTRHPSPVTPLPVLMYHSISDDSEPGVRPYYRICTSPRGFREQMQWLKDNGYQAVTLSAGLEWLRTATQKAENRNPKSEIKTKASSEISAFSFQLSAFQQRPVVLTFDDGFRDFYTHGVPALQHYGFSATMYLPTAYIGNESSCHSSPVTRHSFHGKECLSWNEIQELNRAGIEFGSHTVHHPELVNLPWAEIQSEIADSKAQIENHLGTAVKAFAYPYAFPQARRDFVSRFKDLLATSGYETCVTTLIGRHRPGADPLEIKRLPVNSDDDGRLFQAKLAGGYDWLAFPQGLIKKFKPRKHVALHNKDCAALPAPSSQSALDPQPSDF
jgi:peptidoglycan/xylan/chitin deacetylase (PgdA/CDA1 family)